MKVVCFVKQKEKDSKKFCYPFIVPKKSLRKEHISAFLLLTFLEQVVPDAVIRQIARSLFECVIN